MRSDLTDSPRRRSKRSLAFRLLGGVLAAVLAAFMPLIDAQARRAVVLNVDGAIGPAMADYVVRELGATSPSDTALVVLRMDTPGGLDASMREIVRAILVSPVPVAVYVAPGGSRAASAGTFIMYAGAVAAMAPGTNLGAATPVPLAALPLSPSDRQEQTTPEDADRARRSTMPWRTSAAWPSPWAQRGLGGRSRARRRQPARPRGAEASGRRYRRRRRAGPSSQDRRPDGDRRGTAGAPGNHRAGCHGS